MKLKKMILVAIISIMAIPTINAQTQRRDPNCEFYTVEGSRRNATRNLQYKVKANKIAYLTQRLDLSTQEAEKFWPIFNKYENEMIALRIENSPRDTNSAGFPLRPNCLNMSDKEAQDMLSKQLRTKRDIVNIQDRYAKEFQKAIPVQKVVMFFMLERKFMSDVIGRTWKNQRGDGLGNGNRTGGRGLGRGLNSGRW